MIPDVFVWAGFRVHLLIPNEVVGTLIDDKPTWTGLTTTDIPAGWVYRWKGNPVLQVTKAAGSKATTVYVKALQDIWIAEPGLAVKVAGDGVWRAFGRNGAWVPTTSGVEGWLPLKQKDAHVGTVHFSRSLKSPKCAIGVEFRGGGYAWRFRSNGTFVSILDDQPISKVPYEGCQVFGEAHRLEGTYDNPNETLRRWELAGKEPDIGQFYAFGWTHGPGVVVNAQGRTPVPGAGEDKAPYKYLYNPRAMRKLAAGRSIQQTLSGSRRKL